MAARITNESRHAREYRSNNKSGKAVPQNRSLAETGTKNERPNRPFLFLSASAIRSTRKRAGKPVTGPDAGRPTGTTRERHTHTERNQSQTHEHDRGRRVWRVGGEIETVSVRPHPRFHERWRRPAREWENIEA